MISKSSPAKSSDRRDTGRRSWQQPHVRSIIPSRRTQGGPHTRDGAENAIYTVS